jgi:hypothetical protein
LRPCVGAADADIGRSEGPRACIASRLGQAKASISRDCSVPPTDERSSADDSGVSMRVLVPPTPAPSPRSKSTHTSSESGSIARAMGAGIGSCKGARGTALGSGSRERALGAGLLPA